MRNLRAILLLAAVALCAAGDARARQQGQAGAGVAPKAVEQPLPAEWEGVWKRVLTIAHADGKREEMAMELHVAAVPGGGAKSWKILYAEQGGQSVRPYEIAPVAGEPGRFVVDEKNGLFIDNQLVGKVLFSQFLVTTNVVTTRFEHKGDEIAVEMYMFDARSPRQSRLTGGQIEVSSYKFRSVQHGVLKRERAAPAAPVVK